MVVGRQCLHHRRTPSEVGRTGGTITDHNRRCCLHRAPAGHHQACSGVALALGQRVVVRHSTHPARRRMGILTAAITAPVVAAEVVVRLPARGLGCCRPPSMRHGLAGMVVHPAVARQRRGAQAMTAGQARVQPMQAQYLVPVRAAAGDPEPSSKDAARLHLHQDQHSRHQQHPLEQDVATEVMIGTDGTAGRRRRSARGTTATMQATTGAVPVDATSPS